MLIKVKYFVEGLEPLKPITKGDWIDLRAAEDIHVYANRFFMIPLGVGMILPEGFEAHIVPRSSLFKNFGIIQTNSFGVIDNSYSGDGDQWHFPAYSLKETTIHKNDRICQFRIVENQPPIEFETVEHLNAVDRGGFGSTGTK